MVTIDRQSGKARVPFVWSTKTLASKLTVSEGGFGLLRAVLKSSRLLCAGRFLEKMPDLQSKIRKL
jgi:hypothetical protein